MPLYETVMQEKPPVVLEIGTAYTKLGFAGEAYPRKIMRTTTKINDKDVSILECKLAEDLYDQFVDFLQIIFFKHLLVSPKERKIVIVENLFGPTLIRETLARILFRHFEVSSILFVPLHAMALSTLAVQTAVVVDIGYNETTVLPVFSGVQIMKAFQDQQYGGREIHMEIKKQLLAQGIDDHVLTEKLLEDIKVRACFVTNFDRSRKYRAEEELTKMPLDIKFPTHTDSPILVPGRTRELAFEIMFDENNDRDSLPHLILKSILLCPIDIRKELAENLLIIGGSAMAKGLLARLKAELQNLLTNDAYYKEKFATNTKIKFHKNIGCENSTAWLGASLCGGTDLIHSRSITKEVYAKCEHVPDWICLSDNRNVG